MARYAGCVVCARSISSDFFVGCLAEEFDLVPTPASGIIDAGMSAMAFAVMHATNYPQGLGSR
jgi:hypothetical protein